jgi:cell division protein FtsQ
MQGSTTDMARRSATLPTVLPGDVRLMNATAALFAALGTLALVAVLLAWLVKQPVFNVRAIRIDGDVTRNSVATIRANATPRLMGNYFSLDLGTARAAFEAVPWVRHAVVSRIFPNRLAVRLEEHRAAALWSTEQGDDKLVNTHGEVFEANPGDVEDDALPTLQGPEGSSARLLGLWQRLQPLVAAWPARIETLSMSGRGSLQAELDSGAQIELGRGSDDEIAERTRRFAETLPQVIAQHQRPLVHADLRHNGGYAVRLKGISTTLGPGEKTTGRN